MGFGAAQGHRRPKTSGINKTSGIFRTEISGMFRGYPRNFGDILRGYPRDIPGAWPELSQVDQFKSPSPIPGHSAVGRRRFRPTRRPFLVTLQWVVAPPNCPQESGQGSANTFQKNLLKVLAFAFPVARKFDFQRPRHEHGPKKVPTSFFSFFQYKAGSP